MVKVFVWPDFDGVDKGDGGIRRVVEAQKKYLPEFGIEVINTPVGADVAAFHAGTFTPVDCPVVAHCHGLYWAEYDWANWSLQLNKDVIANLRRADVVTTPSEWVANALRRGMWLSPVVLGHGIDIEDWPSTDIESEGYVLWNKTRIDPVCEVDSLNRLAALAPDVEFRSTFGFAGLKNLTTTGILGYNEAVEQVKKAGVYLCTTRETFGIGTLEAMACGVPILGWDWGGQAEIVEHKVTGYLAHPGDYDTLLDGLRYCIQHRTELGSNARQVVTEKYTWRNAMSRYASLYSQLALRSPTPKVSIIIPLYNLGHYLSDLMASIKKQTFTDYEIIIVDDHSTDNSKEVAESLAREFSGVCRVIQTPKNLYLSGALNYGISQSVGKYIIPIDADNYFDSPNTLEVLSNALDRDRDLHIAYGAMRTINPDGSVYPLPGAPDGISTWPPTDFSFTFQMMHRNQIPSTSMYKREVWARSGGYRRRCRTAEDADFWCRVTSLGFQPHKVTDAVTLTYRVRPESMSSVEPDWDWTAWYPWARNNSLTPMGVPRDNYTDIKVPSYEPPFISVVIPVGPGHTDKVIDAVDSVVAQTFQKWEVIVVNDSGEAIEWIHPFVKLLETPNPKSGPAVARNIGIKSSKGHTFLLLDADDILQPDALERMYEVWVENPNAYIYGDWVEQETGEIHRAPDYDCEELLHRLPHAVTALYPKEAWVSAGGIDTNFEGWEDWDFILSINERGYCGIHIPLITFQYRVRGGNRREELYARREELKQNIYNKWRSYIEGEVKLAGCSSCGGGFTPVQTEAQNLPQNNGMSAANNGSDMVLLEFVSSGFGDMTYRGSVTGTAYRFGSDPEHKVGYVYRQDADHFLSMTDFRLFAGRPAYEEPLLVAPGPPQ